MTGCTISWKVRSILPDRARSRRLEPVAGSIEVSPCPGELMLHPYYIPERKTRSRGGTIEAAEEDRSRRTARPFCLWERITYGEREGEGGSDRVMATRARGRVRGGPVKRERGGTGGGRYQGRVILAPRHVTPVVDRLLGHSTKVTTGDDASSTAIKARLVASTVRFAARSLSCGFLLLSREATGYPYRYPLRGRERARLRQRNCIKSEIERSDGERVRTGLNRI